MKAIRIPTHDPAGQPIHRIVFGVPVGFEGPLPCGQVHELVEHVHRDGKPQYDKDGEPVLRPLVKDRLIDCPDCVAHHEAHRYDVGEVEVDEASGAYRLHPLTRELQIRTVRENIPHHIGEVVEV